ncbi:MULTISPECIES: TonB-dependent receptor plug domain-containing protein [unclassified Sphingomonas]|uniref:TonB-dependent receptor plug domain-containing protein n=1 Tax=unclassified Sphingomonas TaxID=196159 RepID=UPI0012E175BC|nr:MULTISPECIES: TonB-dependent receptor [unclassified Sphingomonas]
MISTMLRASLRTGAAGSALAIGLLALPAAAQTTTPTNDPTALQAPAPAEAQDQEIVVTGSILRTTARETPSPVTVLTAESFEQRGITTTQDAIQQLTSNNGPALTNSFTANGAFGAGASAVSLRGLSTSSTLVLFDGLRAAYYPLSDDGTRNFVDLNTIPDDIVERVEVLRDGASSSYGADAIAGVVNIITKREYKGVGGRAEAGISERGDAANYRLSLTAGTGDLSENGYNAYISGFYFRSEGVMNRERGYPYNTDDLRGVCNDGLCGPNNVLNGLNAAGGFRNGGFSLNTSNFYVQPVDPSNTTTLGRFQKLNPTLACDRGSAYNLTAAELLGSSNLNAPTTVCSQDVTQEFGNITPNIERFGGSARGTFQVGDNAEAYAMVNFQQSTVNYTGLPATIRGNAPAGILFPQYSTAAGGGAFAAGSAALVLPVFVCATGVNCATAADRRLNPNNPFAGVGQLARIGGRLPDIQEYNETRSRVYRAALGINGTFSDDWNYSVNATAMHTDLRRSSSGYVYIANLLSSIATGSYNFVNPSQNSQAVRDFIAPDNITDSSSDLYQAEATIGRELFQLPGGPLQLGVGVAIRYEAIEAPSANPDTNGPTQRYFRLNAFGTEGNRTVYSAFAELNAPIFEQLDVNLSGRYDKYSSGQDAFSPKIGAKFTPIPQLAIRGTYSRGFRIPSFAEANALPTTGYVTIQPNTLPASFRAQYGAACATTPTSCPTYLTTYSLGQTTLASPDLEPEKSRSFTGGIILEPIRAITITVDYYNIKKTGAITSADNTPAIAAYYAGQAIPTGFNVIADAPDPNFPTALPRIAFVQSQLVNSDTIRSEGIDAAVTGRFNLADGVRFTTAATASYILDLSTTFADGTRQRYAGTLGNFNLTAGNGTPRWRASWQNTIDTDTFSVTGVANLFGGYDLSAEDQGDTAGDCGQNPGYVECHIAPYITVDGTATFKVNDKFNFYVNVLNILDDMPPLDPVTYGAHLYNAVQGGNGIIGRAYRAGVKFNL